MDVCLCALRSFVRLQAARGDRRAVQCLEWGGEDNRDGRSAC
jgi:hypothetical protein